MARIQIIRKNTGCKIPGNESEPKESKEKQQQSTHGWMRQKILSETGYNRTLIPCHGFGSESQITGQSPTDFE